MERYNSRRLLVAIAVIVPGALSNSGYPVAANISCARSGTVGAEACEGKVNSRDADEGAFLQLRGLETSGSTITLGVAKNQPGPGEIGAYMYVAPNVPGAKPVRLIIDTGSSTMAFCPGMNGGPNVAKTCFCCDYKGGIGADQWYGHIYDGDLNVDYGKVTMENVKYSVMEKEQGFCASGWGGIFGLAFKGLSVPYECNSSPTFPAVSCKEMGFAEVPGGKNIPSPLHDHLRAMGGNERFGIYWTGLLGEKQGRMYLGDAAATNSHYISPQKAKMWTTGDWFNIDIASITVDGQTFDHGGSCSGHDGRCVIDTGTPGFELPPHVAAKYKEAPNTATLEIELRGFASGNNVKLKFTKSLLDKLQVWGDPCVISSDKKHNAIIGWAMFAFYYPVFDISEWSVAFSQSPATS